MPQKPLTKKRTKKSSRDMLAVDVLLGVVREADAALRLWGSFPHSHSTCGECAEHHDRAVRATEAAKGVTGFALVLAKDSRRAIPAVK